MTDSLEYHLELQVKYSRHFFWHRVRWEAAKSQFPDRPFTLVDVGAGVGLFGDYLQEEFAPETFTYQYTEPLLGLESSLEERFGAENNVKDEDFWEGADVVTVMDVTEHIQDDYEFVGSIIEKMPAGATLVMTVPALNKLWCGWDDALGHYRRYDKPMLRALFRKFPVDVKEISYLFPELLPAAMVRKRTKKTATDSDAEFPNLPQALNRTLEAIGNTTRRTRRFNPRGTSALVVAVKQPDR